MITANQNKYSPPTTVPNVTVHKMTFKKYHESFHNLIGQIIGKMVNTLFKLQMTRSVVHLANEKSEMFDTYVEIWGIDSDNLETAEKMLIEHIDKIMTFNLRRNKHQFKNELCYVDTRMNGGQM